MKHLDTVTIECGSALTPCFDSRIHPSRMADARLNGTIYCRRSQDFTSTYDCHRINSQRNLGAYQNDFYDPGRGFVVRTVWYYLSLLLLESSWLPFSGLKSRVLRLFGASIGRGVVIHPNVRIKFPWKLTVGDNCWIGREVWIDNLDEVVLESDVCISQGAYLCTGSHDHKSMTFELRTGPIRVEHGAWLCCRSIVLGGSTVQRLTLVPANEVYSESRDENPTRVRKPR